MARAWAAGAGPGDSPLTIDLDSTICETYGLAKEGARHHGYTGARGYHPLLAIAAGTGEVLMSRLREGRANTARGAAHFLRETVGRVRYGGARGRLTVRADSGFYAHTVVAACREMDARFSITIRQRASLRDLIEAIPEEDWTPIPYWMDGAADVAETTYTPFQTKPDAAPVRLIVRRVKPTPGSQLALFARYSYHAFITDRDGETLELEADHRRHAEVENAIRDLKYGVGLNHMPSARFAANGAWLAVQVMAHNLARWTARIGLGERTVITKTLRRRVFALVGRITRSARRLTLHLPRRWPWETQFSRALAPAASHSVPGLTASLQLTQRPHNLAMVIKLVVGWDPWKLVGSLALAFTLVLLIPPLLGLALESDPQVVQETTNAIVEQIVAEIPSIVVGDLAGVFAGTILSFATDPFRGR